MKLTTFRTVDKNSLRIAGSVFLASVCQLTKPGVTVLHGAPFFTKAAKPGCCQASQVLRLCSQLPSLFFQVKFSLAKELVTLLRMSVTLVILKEGPSVGNLLNTIKIIHHNKDANNFVDTVTGNILFFFKPQMS